MNVTTLIRCLLVALLAAMALAVSPAVAEEDGGGGLNGPKNNEAVAEPTSAGESVIDLAFSVRETASDVIDETNTAVAYANCEACRAVAIAFQIVIVQGSPGTVTPQNVAVAVNNECPDCSTLAVAYQFVVGRGEPVEFTERGLRRLAKIRKEFEKLERQYGNLTNEEILARTDAFAAEIRDVLANDLVPVGGEGDRRGPPVDREDRQEEDRGDPAATTTTPPQEAQPQTAPAEPPPPAAPPPAETVPPTTTAPPSEAPQEPVPTTTTP